MRFSGSVLIASLFSVAAASGCLVSPEAEDEEGDAELEEAFGVNEGKNLFNNEKFGGNGRTCATCHPSTGLLPLLPLEKTGTISPAQVQLRFTLDLLNDPLFEHDGADTIGGNTFNRLRQHATILIDMPLPSNVRILGSSARNVILPRGVPTTMNTPALDPVLMYDGRHPNLQVQASSAITAHAQGTVAPTTQQLNDIAAFQRTLFNRNNVKNFAENGTPLSMPQGITQSQKRGRRWFISDNQTDPDQAGEGDGSGLGFEFCGFCHSNDNLDETSAFLGLPDVEPGIPAGTRMMNILVSEENALNNPEFDFEFTNGGVVTVVRSADPGLALITGNPNDAKFLGSGTARPSSFKIPSVWGIKETAPYFHDNSAKTLKEVVEHYQVVAPTLTGGFVALTDQDVDDIVAYMNLL